MRVPTYSRQVRRNNAGGGGLLNVSVSGAAAAATGRAISEAGNLMAEIGIKKMQVQTQSQVDRAEAVMIEQLSEIQENALQSNDPVGVEQSTKDDMNRLLKTFTSGLARDGNDEPLLSGRNAKARFLSVGQQLVSAQIIDFTKKNNKRIVEADRGNLDNDIEKKVKQISDTNTDLGQRAMLFGQVFNTTNGIIAKGKQAGTIDDKGFMTRVDQATEQIVRGVALSLFKSSDDATSVALQIVKGESTDSVLNTALSQMDADDKQTVVNSLFTLAEKIDTERREQEEADDLAADANNLKMYKEIINTDMDNAEEVKASKTRFKTLLENNWFTKTQRTAAEAVLGINKKRSNEDEPIETTRNATQLIGNAKVNNTLTAELIESLSGELSDTDYKQAYNDLEQENAEGMQAARSLIATATRYNEFKDTNNALGTASDLMYQESLLELQTWMNTPKTDTQEGGQGASYQQVYKKALEINKKNAEEFKKMMKDALITYITQTQGLGEKYETLPVDLDNPAQAALNWAATQEQTLEITSLIQVIRSYNKIGVQ